VSYGRDRFDGSVVGYFVTPTPGVTNATSGPASLPKCSSRAERHVRDQCAILPPVEHAWQHQRRDLLLAGNECAGEHRGDQFQFVPLHERHPDQQQHHGAGAAFVTNLFPGPVSTKTYIGLANQTNIVNFVSDLPLMILHNFGRGAVPSGSEQFVAVQTFEPHWGALR